MSVAQSDFYQHFPVFNFQRINSDSSVRIVRGFAGSWIPLPAMPGAHDLSALDHSLPQRAATVQADVIHRAVISVDVGDTDGLVAAGKFFGFVDGGEFGLRGELDEFRHTSDKALKGRGFQPHR